MTYKSDNMGALMELKNRISEIEIGVNKIISSEDYILWLTEFSKKYSDFSNDSWLYSHKNIDEKDSINVEKLNLLYNAIENYANKNFISPIKDNEGQYYSIHYNNIGYNVGIIMYQGSLYFCQRTYPNENSINFKDIMENKKQPKTDFYNHKLAEFTEKIKDLVEIGIPIELIQSVINNEIGNIKQNNHEKKHVLKK